MKQKSVGLTLRALIVALALILVAGSPALPPFDGVAYAQTAATNVEATALPAGGGVSLEWDGNEDDSYEVWKGTGSGNSVQWGSSAHATVTGLSYTDTAVTAGSTYSYAVRVSGGAFTGTSVDSLTIPGGVTKPTAKATVTAAAGTGFTAIDVSWTTVDGATGYDLQYWTAGLSGWTSLASNQSGTTYSHTGLTSGATYWYVVRGVNSGGNGPWSDYASHTLTATTTVPVVTLTHTSRTVVTISWTPTGSDMRYDLERQRKVTATNPNDNTTTNVAGSSTTWADLPSALLTATSYTDNAANFIAPADTSTAVHSVKYEYRVRAVDSANQEGGWSTTKSVTIPRAGATLGAPTGLSGSVLSSSNIRVTWNNVDGAAHYELQWKSGDGGYSTSITVNRASGTTSSYNDTGLTPSTKYTYRVRGVNVNGAGDWAAEKSWTTLSTQAAAGQMPKVTGLAVADATTNNAAASRMAKLTWNAVSNASHYQIQRFDPGASSDSLNWANVSGTNIDNGFITTANAGGSPTWTDTFTEGAPGKTYYYVVSAVEDGADNTVNNADDELGEWSDYKSVTFKDFKPGAPTAQTAVKTSGTSVLVSWTQPDGNASADPPTGTATGYTLQWRTSQTGASWNNISVTGTSYHHTGLSGTSTYHYRVRAQNSGGNSAWYPVSPATTSITLGNTLSPPTGLSAVDATSGTGASAPKIKVSWSAVSGASGYEIQRFVAGDTNAWRNLAGNEETNAVTVVSSGSTTSVTDDNDNLPGTTNTGTALTASTTYLYRVRTVKETVKSGWSATVSGTTKATTVGAPTLRATSTGMSMIRLSWSTVAGATGYEIEFLKGSYADAAAFGAANLNRSKITVSGGSHRNYVHTGRTAGTRYSYRIRATLAQGGETAWSAPARQYTKPAAPVLSATSTVSTTMVLKWDAVKFWNTESPGAEAYLATTARYQIQRRLSTSSEWTTLSIGDTACTNNKCTFSDTGGTDGNADPASLTKSTRYYYRIRAVSDTRDETTYRSYWAYRNQQTSN